MKYGLKCSDIESICAVFASYPQVTRALLYGSRAKGNYRKGSDIDLSLEGDAMLTLDVLFRISDALDDLFLPYAIDLSILANISDPELLDHIQRVGKVFYEQRNACSDGVDSE